MACLPKNSLLFYQAFAVSALRAAVTKLWWNVERVKCLHCIFVRHRAQVLAFYLFQADSGSAPLFHPFLLFLWRLGEVHLENRQLNLGSCAVFGKGSRGSFEELKG